ncbi:MAG: RNA polymerase sigma factor [Candidatus Brocadiia bacterium]
MDRDALESLVRAHQAEVYRYMRYLGAPRAAAEDLVQETFLAAFTAERAADPSDERAASAWLRGIARNLFLRYCRTRRTSPVGVDHQFLERAEALWASEFLRDGDGFDYVEALRQCLATLSRRQREALDFRYAQAKSRSEMARLLEMTENGVKSLLRRIRGALADCVRRRLKLGEA